MKQKLPNSARDLLARQETPGEHPSADLLAGFAESTLNAAERQQVTTHLAACADCRDIVFLAGTTAAQQEAAAAAASGRQRSRRMAWLKWAAPVFVALALMSGVLLKISKPASLPESLPASQTVATSQPALPPAAMPAQSVAEIATSPPAAKPESARRTAPRPENEVVAANKKVKRELELQTEAALNVPQPGAPGFDSSSAEPAVRAQPPGGNSLSYNEGPTPHAKTSPQPVESADAAAPPASMQPTVRKAQPTAKSTYAPAERATAIGGRAGLASTASAPPRPAAAAAPQVTTAASNLSENAPNGGNDITYMTRAAPKAAPPALWRITDDGHLQRAAATGQWTAMLADQAVFFHTVAVIGSDVWAGGSDGALFHSTDNGGHWMQVALVADGQTARGAVRSIRFEEPTAGKVTTDDGETWSTSDGGKTWKHAVK